MSLMWWIIGLAAYVALVCLIGAIAGFNSADDETAPAGQAGAAQPVQADPQLAEAATGESEAGELGLRSSR